MESQERIKVFAESQLEILVTLRRALEPSSKEHLPSVTLSSAQESDPSLQATPIP
jgi:hypothetical protein